MLYVDCLHLICHVPWPGSPISIQKELCVRSFLGIVIRKVSCNIEIAGLIGIVSIYCYQFILWNNASAFPETETFPWKDTAAENFLPHIT